MGRLCYLPLDHHGLTATLSASAAADNPATGSASPFAATWNRAFDHIVATPLV